MSPQFVSTKQYAEDQKKSGIKVDDKVKVLRKARNHELGWGMVWIPEMDAYVGKVHTVSKMDGLLGCKLGKESAWFPYFVLQAIKIPKEKGNDYRRIIL